MPVFSDTNEKISLVPAARRQRPSRSAVRTAGFRKSTTPVGSVVITASPIDCRVTRAFLFRNSCSLASGRFCGIAGG